MLVHDVDLKGVAEMLSGGGKLKAFINHQLLDKKRFSKKKKKTQTAVTQYDLQHISRQNTV